MTRRILAVGIAAVAFATLSGCASLGIDPATEKGRFEVEAATVLVIQEAAQPAKRAAEVVESIDKLQNLLMHEQTTVGDLRSALLKRIKERGLTAGELVLANRVVGKIADNIERQVGAGYLSRESVISIDTVLGWAEEIAALYVVEN